MNEIRTYYDSLIKKITEYLSNEYNGLNSISFGLFERVNFYLINSSLNEKKNLLIKTIQKDEKANFYVPIVLSTAISLFFKNFCNTDIEYKAGDILQKAGRRYKIIGIKNGCYSLECSINGVKTSIESNEKQIHRYDIVTADLSDRKVKIQLNDYKALFKSVFNADDFPTKFKHKAAIILEWNDFQEELSHQICSEFEMLKAIPIQRIKKNGQFYECTLPIEPMIYVAPDYFTFQEYIKGNYDIETVIIIGRNKYRQEFFEKIEMDLEYEDIPNAIIVGTEPIQDNSNAFLKWNWTQSEISFLKNQPLASINTVLIEDKDFENAIGEFVNFIDSVEKDNYVRISELKRFKKILYGLVLPAKESRLQNFKEWILYLMLKESENTIKDIFIGLNQNYSEVIEKNEHLISNIFNVFTNRKLEILKELLNIDVLIVPKKHQEIWRKELKKTEQYRIMTLADFEKKQAEYKTLKNVVVLSLFGYEYSPSDLIEKLNCYSHNYTFLAYLEEQKAVLEVLNRIDNFQNKEYASNDRKLITEIQFYPKDKPENISDLIDSFADKSEGERKHYEYENSENVNYALTFEETDNILVLEGSKSVLLHSENRKEQVFNLKKGDKVGIYANLSKEKIFEIAVSEDSDGRFKKIDYYAMVWKKSLQNYFIKKQINGYDYQEENLLNDLNNSGLKVKSILTLKKWVNCDERDKFPSSLSSLIAIKNLVNDEELNNEFEQIKRYRKLYRSIMIALGRNLSDEVMDYVISKNTIKGKMLEKFSDSEIHTFISQSLPIITIKNKVISEEDETE
jgi:hypothetical protein